MIVTIATCPFEDQNPGTSGLRKKLARFEIRHYAENFIQSIFDCTGEGHDKLLIVGGDGRQFNRQVAQKLLKMAAANDFKRVIIGQGGLLSTPAVSHLIRKYKAHGGIILSASHNPGGCEGDFGIKYDISNGGPAPEKITGEIFARSKCLDHYKIVDCAGCDLDEVGQKMIGEMVVEIINPVEDYAKLMEEIFDFDLIRRGVAKGLSLRFDAMHAVTGPYAKEIFVHRLGFAPDSVMNGIPLEDFGGLHPDPNPIHAHILYQEMMGKDAPDLGAASDGDGDRNMIIGRSLFVSPSDSLAILAANAHYVKAYAEGVVGVARSMPTSTAIDRVAQAHGFQLFETPTGWKFFTNLLDSGQITLCGEESFGTGSLHVREKDGIWAILFWLNIMAATGQSVKDIVEAHWRQFGRTYYSRHDYEEVDSESAYSMMDNLERHLGQLPGTIINGLEIAAADNFTYHDPIDGTVSPNQGLRILFKDGKRLVVRLSGTGTKGATVRFYFEHHENDPSHHNLVVQDVLQPLIVAAQELTNMAVILGHCHPSLIT